MADLEIRRNTNIHIIHQELANYVKPVESNIKSHIKQYWTVDLQNTFSQIPQKIIVYVQGRI